MESDSRDDKLTGRYGRIAEQLAGLYEPVRDPLARMGSAAALLHHKMPHFFWTGFYRLEGEDLVVGPYQGPLACLVLERGKGVCWAAVRSGEPVLVSDVHAFEDHIACDPRSASELVVPVRDRSGKVVAVLDVDASVEDAFGQTDVQGLSRVAAMIYGSP